VCKEEGAGILLNIDKMVALTDAVVRSTSLPVTVKTRLGWDDHSIRIHEVAERLQDVGIKALTIHGRTRAQMYKGEADWTMIAEVKKNPRIHIPVFGNGDIDSAEKAARYRELYGVDGMMIGRASIGYPWIFREIRSFLDRGVKPPPPGIHERVDVARRHLLHSIEWKGEKLGVLEMRRHYTNYFKGLPGIKEFRSRLVTESAPEILLDILEEIATTYASHPKVNIAV
jgi:nifR3 family TIM-barrel protein